MSAEFLHVSKRHRQSNTSVEQYELYVFYLESDEFFRTGTINSSVPADYLNIKWNELTAKLNSISNGPQMDSTAWRKRFNGWKDQTRYKSRKIANKIQAGAGPLGKLTLTDLEARALSAWGVAGAEGSKSIPDNNTFDFIDSDQGYSPVEFLEENVDDPLTETESSNQGNYIKHTKRPRALNMLGENIIHQIEKNGESHNKLIEVATKYVEVEKEKLKFEIAKFKFLHPNFVYDMPNL